MTGRRLAVFTVVLLAALVAWSAVMVDRYGQLAYVPGLVSGFAATFVAFVLALEFEGWRESRALEQVDHTTHAARATEARKRLLALRRELEKNQTSIGTIEAGLRSQAEMRGGIWRTLHPQLLDGVWSASGERLGDLLADYELVSDLAAFYGELEELRWRIRYRTQAQSSGLDSMTYALAEKMQAELDGLIKRVAEEESQPGVRGVSHILRAGIGSVQLTPAGSAFFEKTAGEGESEG